jgi:16S rRNA (guanine966-N2)-methyltransferase
VELKDRTHFYDRFKKEPYGSTIISIYRHRGEEGAELD